MNNNAIIFITVSVLLTLVSFFLDKNKTKQGLKRGALMFKSIALPFLNILIFISLVLYFLPQTMIMRYLGQESGGVGFMVAALVGSITLVPAFIIYPIAATLIESGASYGAVAVFLTTSKLVGIVTFPLEAKYFGKKVALIRNILNFVAAIVIGLILGIIL